MKPEKIIFDNDIGTDCDDAGALLLLHRLCDLGEAELVAITHCFATPHVAGCLDAICRHEGRRVPIGINYESEPPEGDTYAEKICKEFENGYPPEDFYNKKIPDTLSVLRKSLAEAEDGEITLVVTGMLDSMARLIMSGPDEYSPLSGRELVMKKIKRTVIMGGRFFETWPMPIFSGITPDTREATWEWNIKCTRDGAANVALDNWCGEIIFSSFEIGVYIKTLVGYKKRADANDPTARIYEIHNGDTGRASWDLCTVLEAVRPGKYWNYHEYGRISVNEKLVTEWRREEGGRHTYVIPRADYDEIRDAIDSLIDKK